jgi:hypothetical protein
MIIRDWLLHRERQPPEKSGSTDDSSTNSSPVSGDGNCDDQNDGSAGSLGADGMMALMLMVYQEV